MQNNISFCDATHRIKQCNMMRSRDNNEARFCFVYYCIYDCIFLSSKQSAAYIAQYAVDNIPLFWTQALKMHKEEFKPLQIAL